MLNGDAKKTVLRMIPHSICALTADDGKGNIRRLYSCGTIFMVRTID